MLETLVASLHILNLLFVEVYLATSSESKWWDLHFNKFEILFYQWLISQLRFDQGEMQSTDHLKWH